VVIKHKLDIPNGLMYNGGELFLKTMC